MIKVKKTVKIKGGNAKVVVDHTTASATVNSNGRKIPYVVLLGQMFAESAPPTDDTKKQLIKNVATQIKQNETKKMPPILFVNNGATQLATGQYSSKASIPIACTCPDWTWRGFACTQQRTSTAVKGCKHMIAVHDVIKAS